MQNTLFAVRRSSPCTQLSPIISRRSEDGALRARSAGKNPIGVRTSLQVSQGCKVYSSKTTARKTKEYLGQHPPCALLLRGRQVSELFQPGEDGRPHGPGGEGLGGSRRRALRSRRRRRPFGPVRRRLGGRNGRVRCGARGQTITRARMCRFGPRASGNSPTMMGFGIARIVPNVVSFAVLFLLTQQKLISTQHILQVKEGRPLRT